jgi:hypothetical protein
MNRIQDPAIRSYYFGKGYADLGAVIVDSWRRNLASARLELVAMRRLWVRSWAAKALALVRGAAAASLLTFGSIFFVAASVVHAALLLSLFLLVYLGFTLVYLAERAYLAVKGFSPVCPDCHSRNPLAEHLCPRCGAVHRRLIPSSYGILHRTCTCGERLPTTFFAHRGRLAAVCPDCGRSLAGLVEVRKLFVPVFGGPATGKSAFLLAVLRDLAEHWAPPNGLVASFPDSGIEADVRRAWQDLDRGCPPVKTATRLPRAVTLRIAPAQGPSRLLYLYDPAGEAFRSTAELALQKYQGYLSGLIFLIDPFSIEEVRNLYSDRLPRVQDALKPSVLPAEDVFARILIGLEEHWGLQKGARLKVPLAVVIDKIDAFGLEQRIGEPALQAQLAAAPAPVDAAEIRNRLVRNQLVRWGLAGLVHQIETRCPHVGYFACTALGRMPDATLRPYAARGVLPPLLWVLSATDAALAA